MKYFQKNVLEEVTTKWLKYANDDTFEIWDKGDKILFLIQTNSSPIFLSGCNEIQNQTLLERATKLGN